MQQAWVCQQFGQVFGQQGPPPGLQMTQGWSQVLFILVATAISLQCIFTMYTPCAQCAFQRPIQHFVAPRQLEQKGEWNRTSTTWRQRDGRYTSAEICRDHSQELSRALKSSWVHRVAQVQTIRPERETLVSQRMCCGRVHTVHPHPADCGVRISSQLNILWQGTRIRDRKDLQDRKKKKRKEKGDERSHQDPTGDLTQPPKVLQYYNTVGIGWTPETDSSTKVEAKHINYL